MPVTARQAIITAANDAGFRVEVDKVHTELITITFGTVFVEVGFDRAGRVLGGVRTDVAGTRRYITGTDRRGQVLALIAEAAAQRPVTPHLFHNGPGGDCGVARCGMPREGHPLPATDRPELATAVVPAHEVRPGMTLVADRRSAAPVLVDVVVDEVHAFVGGSVVAIGGEIPTGWRLSGGRLHRDAMVVVLATDIADDARPVDTGACPECSGVHGHASFCSRGPRVTDDADQAFADVESSAEAVNALEQGGASGLARLDAERAARREDSRAYHRPVMPSRVALLSRLLAL